jgi:hypothetical protein
MSATEKKGVIRERDNCHILDTNAMDWEDHFGLPDAKMKVLSRDEDGNPDVILTWVPPGVGTLNPRGPEKHYHRTVRECGLVLFGELNLREYEDMDDTDPQKVVFKQGTYLDRKPGSVHGLDHEVTSPVGFMWIEWKYGGTHYQSAEGSEGENVVKFLDED